MAPTVSERDRCLMNRVLRLSLEPDALIGAAANPELWQLVRSFSATPNDRQRRSHAGWFASWVTTVELAAAAIPSEQIAAKAQHLGEARADKVLADLDFFVRYFQQYPQDPPYDPSGSEGKRMYVDHTAGGVDATIDLVVAWTNVQRLAEELDAVEEIVFAGRTQSGFSPPEM